MGSMHHPRMYDAATMATIKAAFHDVWDVIIRRLTDLVGEGTTSREELRTKVLNNMPLG